jgi:hypothetical protein
MSNFINIEADIVPQAISETSETRNCALGKIIRAVDKDSTNYGTGEFIYLKGVASTVVGSIVSYAADDFTTSLAVANDRAPIAIAMSANVAHQYGWYQISGKAVGKVLTAFADNAICYLTSTAGSIDDIAVAGDLIYRMKGASAIGTPAAGLAELDIERPFVQDGATV